VGPASSWLRGDRADELGRGVGELGQRGGGVGELGARRARGGASSGGWASSGLGELQRWPEVRQAPATARGGTSSSGGRQGWPEGMHGGAASGRRRCLTRF
jgi:hypothetical protein